MGDKILKLAIRNGERICKEPWPKWPIWLEGTYSLLNEVVSSNRWSLRGQWTGVESKELEFCRRFSQYNECSYCVTTTSGSTGLLVALEALDIGPGDEVIVPALTWIAPITAVLNVGATPVMVDIDPDTTCIDPLEIEKAITVKTKAIIAVHLHCSIADMDSIMELSRKHSLYVIEDCSQAHGAMWGDKYVGTIGHVGVFSMNQEKVLTCGEGGAVITNDQTIYDKMFRTKTDGCGLDYEKRKLGDDQLIYDNKFMGSNYCMSEFHAAIAITQLGKLDEWNEIRRSNAEYLDENLGKIPGLKPLKLYDKIKKRTLYEYAIRIDSSLFSGKKLEAICEALSAELGFNLHQTDAPIYRNNLYSPWTKKRYRFLTLDERISSLKPENFPCSEEVYSSLIVFHHSILLSSHKSMNYIISSFEKIQKYSDEL